MKKLTFIFIMLFSIVTLSQETKKTIRTTIDTDRAVNISLDSLSKVYKKEVVYYSVLQRNGRKKISITYYDKNKNLKHQVISDTPIE